jgi:hypothetical protein
MHRGRQPDWLCPLPWGERVQFVHTVHSDLCLGADRPVYLLQRQAGEVAQLDQLGLDRLVLGQLREGIVQVEQIASPVACNRKAEIAAAKRRD